MSDSKLNENYRYGLDLYDKGLLKEAIRAFEAVLSEMSPNSPEARLSRFYIGEAHAALAETSLQQGSNTTAEEHLNEAIQQNPNFPDMHYQLAMVLLEKGDFQNATLHLNTALELNPDYSKAMLLLGVLAYQIGEYEVGSARIFRSVEMEPRFNTPMMQEGKVAHFAGKHRKALAKFIELSITDIDEISLYINNGKADYRSGEYEAAAKSFRQALQLQDSYPDIHNWLGLSLLACKQADEALEHFEKAISLNHNFVSAIINAGVACDITGRSDAARSYYTRAIVIDPDNPEARERLSGSAKILN
jgi:tetratricopeptide (TPR) repeat protein